MTLSQDHIIEFARTLPIEVLDRIVKEKRRVFKPKKLTRYELYAMEVEKQLKKRMYK